MVSVRVDSPLIPDELDITYYNLVIQPCPARSKSGDRRSGSYAPFALARIKANLTQEELAQRMNVSQAYISKVERQDKVTLRLLERVKKVLKS
ncbi:MAG: helix-turn-helix transcriptional regulator [Pseudomonadota bacterium]